MVKASLVSLLLSTAATVGATPSPLIVSNLIYEKYARATATYRDQYPHLTNADGSWAWRGVDWWTSGFFPATLYLLNERKNLCPGSTNIDWLAQGRKWSASVSTLQNGNNQGHDQGFLSIPFVEELKINPGNSTAQTAIKNFAQLLANRYNPTVGATRSWDSGSPDFLVIVDNMMNLEVLFQAADLGSSSSWRDIAKTHADTTAVNHVRPDGSTYHVVDYNQNTGAVLARYTAQGYMDWSTWTRGQAWATYGYAMMYERTGIASYLTMSRRLGKLFLDRLASSPATIFGVPPWDFDAPTPAPPDTSAATLASTAFLHLAVAEQNLGNSTGANYWRSNAVTLLSNTAEHYFARESTWDAILKNGTSHNPNNVRNTGLVYGDYFFVRAGNLMLQQGIIPCVGSYLDSDEESPELSDSAPIPPVPATSEEGTESTVSSSWWAPTATLSAPADTPSTANDADEPDATGVSLWGQCGGDGYTGPTDCLSGACTALNSGYSQCVP